MSILVNLPSGGQIAATPISRMVGNPTRQYRAIRRFQELEVAIQSGEVGHLFETMVGFSAVCCDDPAVDRKTLLKLPQKDVVHLTIEIIQADVEGNCDSDTDRSNDEEASR